MTSASLAMRSKMVLATLFLLAPPYVAHAEYEEAPQKFDLEFFGSDKTFGYRNEFKAVMPTNLGKSFKLNIGFGSLGVGQENEIYSDGNLEEVRFGSQSWNISRDRLTWDTSAFIFRTYFDLDFGESYANLTLGWGEGEWYSKRTATATNGDVITFRPDEAVTTERELQLDYGLRARDNPNLEFELGYERRTSDATFEFGRAKGQQIEVVREEYSVLARRVFPLDFSEFITEIGAHLVDDETDRGLEIGGKLEYQWEGWDITHYFVGAGFRTLDDEIRRGVNFGFIALF